VGAGGRPSARMVLLKGVDSGFVFFTNYESRKAGELESGGYAALVFYWPTQHRQVRVEGAVGRVPADESDSYFASRPHGSRIGAWASRQSQVIAGREPLERRYLELSQAYAERDIPRPPHWGGYRVLPDSVEFWQGRPSRLHDRLRYRRDPAGPAGRPDLGADPGAGWVRERLSP